MSEILLFCVAEKAKPVSAFQGLEILGLAELACCLFRRFCANSQEGSPPLLCLVESNVCHKDQMGFKLELKDDEPFESDFINASKEQCQKWAQEHWTKVTGILEQDIAIADERTARDGTLLMSTWRIDDLDSEGRGPLPSRIPAWYNFRVHHRAIEALHVSQHRFPYEEAFPICYGQPEKYTGEAGVFDSLKVYLWMAGDLGRSTMRILSRFLEYKYGYGSWVLNKGTGNGP